MWQAHFGLQKLLALSDAAQWLPTLKREFPTCCRYSNHLLGIFEYEKNKYAARDAHNFQSPKAFASTTSQPLKFIAHAAVEKAESSVKVVLFNLPQVTIHTSLSPVQKKIATPKKLGLPKGSSDTLVSILYCFLSPFR
ncbi:hypothetical protein K435DRAFT_930742 [Dendrothele bispora CBS 962.96]|uniref:Uncharacterized protein n=1 Tax=Dendrothele bispora (strain CBS 962.96) TaxID=1314807 RepID=A0A4S8L4S4_DENBC|nr:hypothetical protein K435DRAFT_930742 [Dendrothele bispora CBS 962.96]